MCEETGLLLSLVSWSPFLIHIHVSTLFLYPFLISLPIQPDMQNYYSQDTFEYPRILNRFDSWVGKFPWGKEWQPTSVIIAWRIPGTEKPGGCFAVPGGWARVFLGSSFYLPSSTRLEAGFPYHDSRAMTLSPSPS